MSVSLYYTAKREHPLSDQEKSAYQKVVEHYIAEYPLGDLYEDFCVYDFEEDFTENVIFDGSTKLPLNEGEEHCLQVLNYWADCLQEIIDLLPDAQWNIHVDDADITSQFHYSNR
ncbi:hypothetical protein D3Z58_12360 [Clostridiaceae bacterium]|nr:hypothetical protein [Clostridiaceae bacterium]